MDAYERPRPAKAVQEICRHCGERLGVRRRYDGEVRLVYGGFREERMKESRQREVGRDTTAVTLSGGLMSGGRRRDAATSI